MYRSSSHWWNRGYAAQVAIVPPASVGAPCVLGIRWKQNDKSERTTARCAPRTLRKSISGGSGAQFNLVDC